MNPRTFLPLPEVATSEPPARGDEAPEIPDAARGEPAVVAFLRHPGCPFAEQTLRSLRAAAGARPDVRWVAVTHASEDETERWVRAVGGADGVELLVDEDRRLYGAWGVGRTDLRHFMGPNALRAVLRLARHGVRNRHPHGTRWQAAATFAVDRSGSVRWRHLPEHAGDLPELERAGAEAAS